MPGEAGGAEVKLCIGSVWIGGEGAVGGEEVTGLTNDAPSEAGASLVGDASRSKFSTKNVYLQLGQRTRRPT